MLFLSLLLLHISKHLINYYNYHYSFAMINRLLAENTIKINKIHSQHFSLTSHLLAFYGQSSVRIKSLTKQAKDIDITINTQPLRVMLSQHSSWLYILTSYNLLQIYQIEYLSGLSQGNFRKIAIIRNVMQFSEMKSGLTLSSVNKVLKHISFEQIILKTKININVDAFDLKSISKLQKQDKVLTNIKSHRIIIIKNSKEQTNNPLPEKMIQIYGKVYRSHHYQQIIAFSTTTILAHLYQERYIFQLNHHKKSIQIIDIEQLKIVGTFQVNGGIKFAEIHDNVLIICTEQENTDIIHLFHLRAQTDSMESIVTHKICYERGKSDEYKFYNVLEDRSVVDKRKSQVNVEGKGNKTSEKSYSMLYALLRQKQKIQILKINHSSLLSSPFSQQKTQKSLFPRQLKPEMLSNLSEELLLQKQKINSLIQLKSNSEIKQSDLQTNVITHFLDMKIKNVLMKFQEFQKRIQRLQKIIGNMNKTIQENIQKINREEIKEKIQKLFDRLTPQFQKYFNDIFKQFTGVIQQGVHYYNMKLAKEAEMHKEILTQIVTQTFKTTEEITQISRKQQKISEKTEQTLKRLLQTKRKWTKSSQEHQKPVKTEPQKSKIDHNNDNKTSNKSYTKSNLNASNNLNPKN